MERFIERSLDQRVRGVIRARACTDRVKECSDRTHAERKREIDIYIYIYKSSLFSPRSESTNPPAEQTHVEPIYTFERSNVLPCFPPPMRAPSRRRNSSQTFRKILWNIQFSYFYLNLEKSYNIYKIIFYINIIYFITFSFVNNSLKSILKI